MIFFLTLFLFEDSFLYVVTITFSALVVIESLNIYSTVSPPALSPLPRSRSSTG